MLITNNTSSLLTLDGYSIAGNGQYDLTGSPGPILFAAWRSSLVSLPIGISLLNDGGTITIFPPFATGTDTSVEAVLGYTPLPSTTPYVASFNGRGGTVNLTSVDVTNALGYTPALPNGNPNSPLNAQNATTDTQVVPYGQLYQYLGAEMPAIDQNVPPCPSRTLGLAPRGWVTVAGTYTDGPFSPTTYIYGLLVTRNTDVTNTPPAASANSTTAWYHQELYLTRNQKYIRYNTNGAGWTPWVAGMYQDMSGNSSLGGNFSVGGTLTVSGNTQLTGTLFDQQNSGYYLKPSGTSVLSQLNTNNQNIGAPVNTGGVTWLIGNQAWTGSAFAASGINSVTGVLVNGGAGSQLFTLASGPGQLSLQLDGSIFIGDGLPYNPFNSIGSTDGSLVVQGNASVGGLFAVQGSATFVGGVTVNNSQIVLSNSGQSSLYTDSGTNDLVIKTGAYGAYKYTVHYANGDIAVPGNVSSSGPNGFYALNNSGLNINDSSGTSHLIWHMSTDNYPTWINVMGTHVRVVNQAYNAELWTCDNSGNMWALGNVTAYSDERFKSGWSDFSPDFVHRLAGVRAGSYIRTDSPAKGLRQLGVGAQSLQPVMPEAIGKNEQGHLTVAYGNAALAAAVYLARHAVGLEARIRDLEDRL